MARASAASHVSVELCVLITSNAWRASNWRSASTPRAPLREMGTRARLHAVARGLGEDARLRGRREQHLVPAARHAGRFREDANLLAAPAQRRLGVQDGEPHGLS